MASARGGAAGVASVAPRTSRALLFVAFGMAAHGLWAAPKAPASPARGDISIEARSDGSVRLGGVEYPSFRAYFASPAFREHGARCGTDTSPYAWIDEIAPTDCSLQKTVPSPDYAPADALVIPVVWHVIEASDGTGALPDDRIDSQMAILNEDFRAWPATPGEDGEDARIHFALARETPGGRKSSGIERYESDAHFHDDGSGAMQRALAWDPDRYLNIYTNHASVDGETPVLGYATLPQAAAGTPEDGVVLHYAVVGRDAPDAYPYDQGRTATHEVGHYLGLLHPFDNGCGDPARPYTTGDLLADTPPEDRPTFRCATSVTGCDTFASIHNYMNYTPDACMARFSSEQILRMRCAAIHYRPELFFERAPPDARFEVDVDGRKVHVSDLSSHRDGELESWTWDFGDGHTSTERHPRHTYEKRGRHEIALKVADDIGLEAVATTGIVANTAPTAAFAAEIDDMAVELIDTSDAPGGSIVAWTWDFGDGNTSAARRARHVYDAPGVYTATLTVTDDLAGRDTATLDLVVGDGAGCACAARGRAPEPVGAGLVALAALAALACLRRRRA